MKKVLVISNVSAKHAMDYATSELDVSRATKEILLGSDYGRIHTEHGIYYCVKKTNDDSDIKGYRLDEAYVPTDSTDEFKEMIENSNWWKHDVVLFEW